MLPGKAAPASSASLTHSEPMPTSLPSASSSAAPLCSKRGGATKMPPSIMYSHQPVKRRRDTTHARETPPAPPWAATSTVASSRTSVEDAHLDRAAVDAGAQHPEARGVVVADHARRVNAPVAGDHQDGIRLQHQVADSDDQPLFAEHHAGAFALGAEVFGGARVRHCLDGELHHAFERHVVGAQVRDGDVRGAPGGKGGGEKRDGHGWRAR